MDQRFSNSAAERLQARLAPEEAAELPLMWAPASWEPYLQTYMRGIRQFRLRESPVPAAATGPLPPAPVMCSVKAVDDADKVASMSWRCCSV